jgi:5-methylcytosine-specific restriction endonuclease McrBC regulatory subunit McrC
VPGFVNYKKGCTRLAAASDKVYQLLAYGLMVQHEFLSVCLFFPQLVSNHIGVPFIPVSEAHTNLFYIFQQYLYIVCIEQTLFGSKVGSC